MPGALSPGVGARNTKARRGSSTDCLVGRMITRAFDKQRPDTFTSTKQGGNSVGHLTLGILPTSKKWTAVVALLAGGEAAGAVVAGTARAAERDLRQAAGDPVFVEAVRLLLTIPHAARSSDYGDALRREGIEIGSNPHLIDLVAAVSARLDEAARGRRTDFGELAARALISTLSTTIGDALPSLFAAEPSDVQATARKLATGKGIAIATRTFFGNLVSGTLSYWLDRTLATNIGPGRRFADSAERAAFDADLAQHSAEATRVLQEFSGGWYGKRLHRDGRIDRTAAAEFGAVSLKKIVDGLKHRHALDA